MPITQNAPRLPIFLLSLAIALPALVSAQGMSDADIQQAVTMMRATGQSDEQIQKFIDSMKGAQVFANDMDELQVDGRSEMDAARLAAGFDEADVARMNAIEEDFANSEALAQQDELRRAIGNFRREHADKPNATAVVDGATYRLKVIECRRDGALFSVIAEGEPTRSRHKGPELRASRAAGYLGGGYREAVSFRTKDTYASVTKRTGVFEGDTFVFDGKAKMDSKDGRIVAFSAKADCT